MQNTRLSTLIDRTSQRFTQWTQNPWRRSSLIIISLLFGNFLASSIVTSAGQKSDLDIAIALMMLSLTEFVSWLTYRDPGRRQVAPSGGTTQQRPLWLTILNSLRIGLVYGLFVEAFKLGS